VPCTPAVPTYAPLTFFTSNKNEFIALVTILLHTHYTMAIPVPSQTAQTYLERVLHMSELQLLATFHKLQRFPLRTTCHFPQLDSMLPSVLHLAITCMKTRYANPHMQCITHAARLYQHGPACVFVVAWMHQDVLCVCRGIYIRHILRQARLCCELNPALQRIIDVMCVRSVCMQHSSPTEPTNHMLDTRIEGSCREHSALAGSRAAHPPTS
jgi:hypothetical protein